MAFLTEKPRQIPADRACATLVAGGGIAGIAAALAAARGGAKVLLVENQYMLGGLATAGLVAIYLPLCDGEGRQVSFGIAEELLRLSVQDGHEGDGCPAWLTDGNEDDRKAHRFEVQYNPYVFAIRAEQLLLKEGVEILYGSAVCDTMVENDRITHVILETPAGREAVTVKNVIDATGDADICRLSGEKTAVFQQGNVPAGWYYTTEQGANRLKTLGFADIPDDQKTAEQKQAAESSLRFTGLDADELTRLTVCSHRSLLEDFLKEGAYSETHALSSIASIPQIRMTRRLCGVYTQHDTEMHREFADSVGLFSNWRKRGPVYELPFSTLYGHKVKNLLAAGRCISVTDAQWDITRVIPVCAVSGQAAGTAAAMTDGDFASLSVKALQKALTDSGVVLHEKEL